MTRYNQNVTYYNQNVTNNQNVTSYNQNVTRYNQYVTNYNQNVTRYKENVTSYDRKVTSYNQNVSSYNQSDGTDMFTKLAKLYQNIYLQFPPPWYLVLTAEPTWFLKIDCIHHNGGSILISYNQFIINKSAS